MQVTGNQAVRRKWIPLILIFVASSTIGAMILTEFPLWKVMSLVVSMLLMILLLLWWIFLTGRFRPVSLLVALAVAIILPLIFRYDGSLDGSAFPRFAFRWTPETEVTQPLDITSATDLKNAPPPHLIDSPGYAGGEGRSRVQSDGALNWKRTSAERTLAPPHCAKVVGLDSHVVGPYAVTQEQRGSKRTGQLLRPCSLARRAGSNEELTPFLGSDVAASDRGPHRLFGAGRVYAIGRPPVF